MHLPRGATYIPGELIESILEINNPRRIRIKRIECHVERTVEVGDDSFTIDVLKINLPRTITTNEANQREIFEVQLPEDLPPSYKYTVLTGLKPVPIVVEYAIIFQVRVIGILSDFQVVKSIVIATKITNDNQQAIQASPMVDQENSNEK